MFYCQVSKKMSKLGEAQHKITIATRPKEYFGWKLLDEEDDDFSWVKVSEGVEIVKQVNACEDGLVLWESWDALAREAFVKSLNPTSDKKEPVRRVVR
jgi:hypothetical protein